MRHTGQSTVGEREAEAGRLLSRPGSASASAPHGLHRLGLEAGRDGQLYVPRGYRAERPAPLVLMLHGAGGSADHGLAPLLALAEEYGLILLAPDSRGRTWDLLIGGYGADVEYIDRALAQAFGRYAVDPSRLAVEGFSDGASYALSLGLTNGDLFSHVLAFSPGFLAPATQRGRPRIYVSHGVADQVLPIEACSRRIAPTVRRAGYDLRYVEFEGGHTVPPGVAREAVAFFLEG